MSDKKRVSKSNSDKIRAMFENYGMNVDSMEEEEFERILQEYQAKGTDLNKDYEDSKQYRKVFEDDVI